MNVGQVIMVQLQRGLADPSDTAGNPNGASTDFERAVSFRFSVTWSSLSQAPSSSMLHAPPRPATVVVPIVERPRVAPTPKPPPPAPVVAANAVAYADQLAPVERKKSPATGFQWEMVVPRMVRSAKKPVLAAGAKPSQRRLSPVSRDSEGTASAVAEPRPPAVEPSAPNLYTGPTSFLRSFGFKLCVGVAVVVGVIVPIWRHVSNSGSSEVASTINGGDWVRQSAVSGDPGVKQSRQLVLYRPALKTTDSRMEFDWTVNDHPVGWVFRAKDLGNYYGVQLKVLKPDANPTFGVEYFSVYKFVESPHQSKVLVFPRSEPVLRVRMDVFGPVFTLYLQGNATEYWSDARMTSGAIGFFEEWNQTPEIGTVRMSFPERTRVELPLWDSQKLLATTLVPALGFGRKNSGGN